MTIRKPLLAAILICADSAIFTSSAFSQIYEDTNTLVRSYLDNMQIVPYIHQKFHPIPANALPNDSEALCKNLISSLTL